MKKQNYKIFSLLIAVIFSSLAMSCSQDKEYLTSNYWTRITKKKGARNIVEFTKNGIYIDHANYNDEFKYTLSRNKIKFTDEFGKSEDFFIDFMPKEDKFKLTEITEVGDGKETIFRKALESDFFLGKWEGKDNESHIKFDFDNDGLGKYDKEIDGFLARKDFTYHINETNSVSIDSVIYKYKFSKDKQKLKISLDGKLIYSLSRELD